MKLFGKDKMFKFIHGLLLLLVSQLLLSQISQARDFEDNYAVYGAGADSCGLYLQAMKSGGKAQDYFIDWTIGYLSAFNVIMPSTYNVLGDTEFTDAQDWLDRHCQRFPKEPFIHAVIKLTEKLYPMRYQAGLKKPAKTPARK